MFDQLTETDKQKVIASVEKLLVLDPTFVKNIQKLVILAETKKGNYKTSNTVLNVMIPDKMIL